MKHLRVAIDEELHKTLKVYAAKTDKTLPEVVTEALRKFLEDKSK